MCICSLRPYGGTDPRLSKGCSGIVPSEEEVEPLRAKEDWRCCALEYEYEDGVAPVPVEKVVGRPYERRADEVWGLLVWKDPFMGEAAIECRFCSTESGIEGLPLLLLGSDRPDIAQGCGKKVDEGVRPRVSKSESGPAGQLERRASVELSS